MLAAWQTCCLNTERFGIGPR